MAPEDIHSLSKTTKLLLLDSLLQEVCIESGSDGSLSLSSLGMSVCLVSHNLLYSGLKKAHSKKENHSGREKHMHWNVLWKFKCSNNPPQRKVASWWLESCSTVLWVWGGKDNVLGLFASTSLKYLDVHLALLLGQLAQIQSGCCQSVSLMATKDKTVQNVYSNLYSQAVTHPSTNRSQPCLTSVIGRELVYSRWYGRRHENEDEISMQWSQMQKKAKGWVKSTQVDHIEEVRWCALNLSTNGF